MAILKIRDKDGKVTEIPVLTVGGGNVNPNCHAEYFNITDDGELSLKPEYRGASTDDTFEASISDMGAGAVGSKNTELPKDLVIPEVVKELAVDRLSAGMFMNNEVIEVLTIPVTVDEIPESFCNMAVNLKELKNTEHIVKVGGSGFLACRLEKVVMPNLEELGTMSFGRNAHLIYADIGKTTIIEPHIFRNDIALTKVKSDGNITSIGEGAFATTPRLTNLNFVENLTSIGDYGFLHSGFDYDWSSLSNCTFGTEATHLQVNPTDFWSNLTPVPSENPLPTRFCQKDKRWADRQIGNSGRYYGKSGCGLVTTIHAYCGVKELTLSHVSEFEDIINATDPEFLNAYTGTTDQFVTLLNTLGVTATMYSSCNADVLTALYSTLANGGYAYVSVQASGAHAVLVYGVNEKKELLCLDSDSFYYYDSSKPALYKVPVYQLIDSSRKLILVNK